MNLKELIEALRAADQTAVLAEGFGRPRSYRGYYEDLAFEPATNVTVASMLAHAESAMGKTFTGYKGGEYEMGEYTTCWIAEYGDAGGEMIGPMSLKYMLSTAGKPIP